MGALLPRQRRWRAGLLIGLLATAAQTPDVRAYIDRPPEKLTLPRLLLEFKSVGIFRVDRADMDRGLIRYRLVETLQGQSEPRTVKHAAPLWIRVLSESRDAALRCRAAGALGTAFGDLEAAEVALRCAAADTDRHVRSQATHSLRRIYQGPQQERIP